MPHVSNGIRFPRTKYRRQLHYLAGDLQAWAGKYAPAAGKGERSPAEQLSFERHFALDRCVQLLREVERGLFLMP